VTLNAGADLQSVTQYPGVYVGPGAIVTNNGRIYGDRPNEVPLYGNAGIVTIRGAGNTIVNNGRIEAQDGAAIQGNRQFAIQGSSESGAATGTVLDNRGVISSTASATATTSYGTVILGAASQVTNSGQILLNGGGSESTLNVGDGSRIENQGTGLIQAIETRSFSSGRGVNGVTMGSGSTLINAGKIVVVANVAGSGAAVRATGAGSAIVNSGTIDASKAGSAITTTGTATITNSGTILGGSSGAIAMNKANGSQLTLQTGSQIGGAVTARDSQIVPKTDADWNNNAQAIALCQQFPSRGGCNKVIEGLPQQATLRLEGTGTEDDKLSGFNSIEKPGAGTWSLATSLQAGSTKDGTGDFLGPLNVDVQDAAGQFTLTGAITDNPDGTTGQLVKNGAGLLALFGNNTYSGATAINAGTLQANGGNAIGDLSAVSVAGGATLALGASETIGSLAGAGTLSLGGNVLSAGGDNSSTTFSGDVGGSGRFEKYGTGTLRLSGASTGTGDLFVQEGTLDMAGSTPRRVAVSPVGTLIGTGTLGGLTNLGRVAPGNNGVGTLSVTGNYFHDTSGTLEIEIAADDSGADLLAVGGTAILGGTLEARTENQGSLVLTPAMDGTYTVLTAGGGVTGQFDSAPAGTSGAFRWGTVYNPNDVQIVIDYVGFTPIQTGTGTGTAAALTPAVIPGTGTTNQISKALALDRVPVVAPARSTATTPGTSTTPSTTTDPGSTGFASGNPDFDRVLLEIANETPDQLAATYNAIIAEPYAAFLTVLLEQNDFYAETVIERAQLCSARGRGSLAGGYAASPLAAGERLTDGCPNHERHGVWLDATWLEGNIDGEEGLSGYDYRLAGAVLGADTAIGANATVGAAFGFGQPRFDNYDLADAEIDGDSYLLSAYGTFTRERWEFFGLLGYTFGNYESERRIRFGSIDRVAEGDFDGSGLIASAKAAYDVPVQGFDLIPEVGLTYSKVWQDGFTESGANSLDLKVDDADAHSLVTSLGVRLGTELTAGATRIRPQLLARFEYDWNANDDDAHDVVSTFAGVPTIGDIDVIGQNRGEHGFTLAGGATVQVSQNANLFAGAGYRWNSNGDEYNLGLGARVVW
jgi:autotransporter-associated beta strand protein